MSPRQLSNRILKNARATVARAKRTGARRLSTNHNEDPSRRFVRPYSDSLPTPGHEWCSRCQIPLHSFQKPLGKPDSCSSTHLPWMMGWCPRARKYVHAQVSKVAMLAMACFVTFPALDSGGQDEAADMITGDRVREKSFSG